MLKHSTYIIVSCKKWKKKLKMVLGYYGSRGKHRNILRKVDDTRLRFLSEMELWFKWSRFFIRYVEIHNGSFELTGWIFRKFSMFHEKFKLFRKISSIEIIDLITIKASWMFYVKSLNGFSDILAGVSKNFISRKTKIKWKTP